MSLLSVMRQWRRMCCLLLLPILPLTTLPTTVHAGEILDAAKDFQPNENGLPPPLAKPLNVSICFFDMQGKNGDFYSLAKDIALIAQRWNIIAELKVFNDERVTAESFKAGQCDAAGISTMRARQFNSFIGSIDAAGAVPSYDHMRLLIKTILDPKLIPLSITEPYQIIGILPVGALYTHVRDRSINSIEKAAGKKVAVLDWDKTQAEIVEKIGAQPVASDLSNFGGRFNNGEVDIIVAPALVYRPFELYRGLGDHGGIYRFPIAQMTGSLVINRERLKQKLPDLDDKMLAFRSMSLQFLDQMLDQIFAMIIKTEKDIPAKYWLSLEPENEAHYREMLREARIKMTKEGYYDPRMMKVMKKVRCKLEPAAAECSQNDE